MFATMHRRFALLRNLLLGSVLLAALEAAFAAITVTESVTPSLGTLLGGASGRNFILNTDGSVSGGAAADYLFGAVSGNATVKKTAGTQSANIVADTFSTTGGVIIKGVPCKWDTDTATTCDGSGINVTLGGQVKHLLVGVDLDTSQVHSGGDSPTATYDINVTLLKRAAIRKYRFSRAPRSRPADPAIKVVPIHFGRRSW